MDKEARENVARQIAFICGDNFDAYNEEDRESCYWWADKIANILLPKDKPELRERIDKILNNPENYHKIDYPAGSAPWAEDPIELDTEKAILQLLALIPDIPKDRPPLLKRNLGKDTIGNMKAQYEN